MTNADLLLARAALTLMQSAFESRDVTVVTFSLDSALDISRASLLESFASLKGPLELRATAKGAALQISTSPAKGVWADMFDDVDSDLADQLVDPVAEWRRVLTVAFRCSGDQVNLSHTQFRDFLDKYEFTGIAVGIRRSGISHSTLPVLEVFSSASSPRFHGFAIDQDDDGELELTP